MSWIRAEGGLFSAREDGRRMVQGVTKDEDIDVGQAARRSGGGIKEGDATKHRLRVII